MRHSEHFGQFADNDRKGCGGVIRVAPAAFELGCDPARYTHGHPTGYPAAGALVALLWQLLDGRTLHRTLDQVLRRLPDHRDHAELNQALRRAVSLAEQPAAAEVRTALEQALALAAVATPPITVYCALVAPDLEQAVNHGGDSDGTGAITGNILGPLHGPDAIPARRLERLEPRETIDRLARDPIELPRNPGQQDRQRLRQRYPGW